MMPSKEKRVLDFINKYNMAAPGQTVVVAVSGGADSMCLLDILSQMDLNIIAAHYNHNLRGEESDGDEEFVRSFCFERLISFFSEKGDVKRRAEEWGKGIEETARIMRYEFLEKAAEKYNAHKIATAHNADDNTETVIMNIVRGTGLDGLCGIPPVRGDIIRPVLCLTREEIEEYLKEKEIPNIFDSSNNDQFYRRNRIRHSVIPVLREMNPKFSSAILSMTERLSKDSACLNSMAEGFRGENISGEIRFDVGELGKQPEAVRMRIIKNALHQIGIKGESRMIKSADDIILGSDPSAAVSLKSGKTIRREYGQVVFSDMPIKYKSFRPIVIALGAIRKIPELGIEISCNRGIIINSAFTTLYFKSSAICGNITVRPRIKGDKIALAGRGCTKTLKKLFIEEKIPEIYRDCIPVFADAEGVIAVMGLGIAERCKPDDGDDVISLLIKKECNTVR